ncbi:MAG: UDP-N-acetylmuramoyl-L-alanine--D-glutamate ligase [Treponema sp.]|jgi:UDP-N-acetylmuramoylalanine--D-glutamate ligase|nr:UDP-N-acetylmuramoyl-L-alanine--D-glutamate ligase [Treponema sp.]
MDYSGAKVLIMGIGLHGGGLESARFFLRRGASVTVTDLRDEKTLSPSIEQLEAECRAIACEKVRYVLGKHETEYFQKADIVIKNPGVMPDSTFLQAAKRIETDISVFLSESKARLFAVTGSKGKSCAASALHWILKSTGRRSFLGGNITVSPLSFLDGLTENDDVVLELSSWQLGDLKGRTVNGAPLLKPKAAVLTAIMPDHLDRYASMEEYIDDKRNIYRGQDKTCVTVAGDDSWGASFRAETKGRPLVYSRSQPASTSGGWLNGSGFARLYGWPGVAEDAAELVPSQLLTPGEHQKMNLLAAALAPYSLGTEAEKIREALAVFPGVEHRLELFHKANGIHFYNDSAATIPEAAAACIEALIPLGHLTLVTGGTDKKLDFSVLAKAAVKAQKVVLLAGSGSEKLMPLLAETGVKYHGPFDNLDKAVQCALENTASGYIVALSPGCSSFQMFTNEFDRGRKWKEACQRLS